MRAVVRVMRALRFGLVAGTLVAALSGCMPRPLIQPLGPAALGRSVEARQQVTVHYRGKTRRLQMALRVVPHDLTLVGLSAMGQRVFTLGWNGRSIERGRGLDAGKRIPAKRILADLELAYWPLPALRQALTDPDLRLQQLGNTRTLWRGTKLVWLAYRAHGNPWHSRLTIYNARLGYRLDVKPLAFSIPAHS